MSGAPSDRGFHQRETGMDQGTTPEANIISLLGKKKKHRGVGSSLCDLGLGPGNRGHLPWTRRCLLCKPTAGRITFSLRALFRRSEPPRTLHLQPTRFLALLDDDWRSLAEMLCKLKRIPVRQTNAAMRGRFADLVRIRSAMDAVTLGGKIDPHGAYWVVWSRRYVQLFIDVNTTEMKGGIIMVDRVFRDLHHFELALRSRAVFASYSGRIDGNELVSFISLHSLPVCIDLYP